MVITVFAKQHCLEIVLFVLHSTVFGMLFGFVDALVIQPNKFSQKTCSAVIQSPSSHSQSVLFAYFLCGNSIVGSIQLKQTWTEAVQLKKYKQSSIKQSGLCEVKVTFRLNYSGVILIIFAYRIGIGRLSYMYLHTELRLAFSVFIFQMIVDIWK